MAESKQGATEQVDAAYYESNQQQLSEISREDILRQVFGDVGDLIDDFSCAVETTVLLHGRMYVTSRFLCFYSNLFGLEKKIRIPYSHITQITKENTVLVIPNAIAITTYRKEYLFRSFWDRDECFRILKDFIDTYKHGANRRSSVPSVAPSVELSEPAGSAAGARLDGSGAGDGDATASQSLSKGHSSAMAALGALLPNDDDDDSNDEDEDGEDGNEEGEREEGDDTEDEDEDSGFSAAELAAGRLSVPLESMTPVQLLEAYTEEEAKSRLKTVVTSGIMPLSVAEFAELFVEDGAEHSWLAYHALVLDTSLELSAWADMPSTLLGKTRELKFFKPVNLPGLKSTRGVKVQRYRRFGDAGLVVCSSTRLEDVPAADTFSVEDMISVQQVLTATGEEAVQVEITFEVFFLKTTMFRYLIERNTQSEMLKWLEVFFAHVQKCAIEHRRNGPQTSQHLAIENAQRRRSASEGATLSESKALRRLDRPGRGDGGSADGLSVYGRGLAGGRAFWAAWLLLLSALLFGAWQWKGVNARLDRLNGRIGDLLEAQRNLSLKLEQQCPNPKR